MGLDLLAVSGECGREPLVGQHCSELDVESWSKIVRRLVGEADRDGWWDDVLRALIH
jgi:hypothetical protein